MKSTALKRCWSLFGGVLILSIALLNASCCSHRATVKEQQTASSEQRTQERDSTRSDTRTHTAHEATLTQASERQEVTVTEIEIFAPELPPDSTGAPRLKARIRQRHGETEKSRAEANEAEQSNAEATTESGHDLTAESRSDTKTSSREEKAPSLWDKIKQGAAWAAALLILTAAAVIIYKIIKRKKS